LTGALLVLSGLFARSVAAVLVSGLILSALSYAALNALAGSLARSTQSPISDALARVVDPLVRLSTRVFPALTRREFAAAAAADATAEGEREAVEELIEEGVREGIGDSEDMKLVSGVVELRDTLVREIMVSRQDVFALPAELPPYEIARRIASSGYSRVPIYSGDLDAIAGIFHVLDVLKLGPHDLPPLRPVVTAGTSDRCSDLLLRMLRQHAHICIVTDAAGHTAGIVTLEDLLEEIVGEIQDEFDEPVPATAAGQAGK
jgi:CBS domain containing-hemolysin-like protein